MRFALFCIFPGQIAIAAGMTYETAAEAKRALKGMGVSTSGETWYIVDTQSLRVRAFRLPKPDDMPEPAEVIAS